MMQTIPNNCPVILATPAQAFFHLGIKRNNEAYRLTFSVKAESNIRCYLIEGSHDLVSFERITRVFAKGNSPLPSSYSVTIRDTDYVYYRIRQIDNATAVSLSNEELIEPATRVTNPSGQLAQPVLIAPVSHGAPQTHGIFF